MLVDDHPIVRQALKDLLEKEVGFEIIAEASDGEEAVDLAAKLTPTVVIMDIGIPKLNGFEATRRIKVISPDTIVLVLTVHDDIAHILGMLEAGADGYLTKTVLVQEIVQAIRSVVTGEAVLSPQIFRQVVRYALKNVTKPYVFSDGAKITTRELEIIKLLAKSRSNKQIAKELNIGLGSVKSHLVDVFTKLNAVSRTEAVIKGLRAGFLNLSDLD